MDQKPGRLGRIMLVGVVVCLGLVWGGLIWRDLLLTGKFPDFLTLKSVPQILPTLHHPFLELLKLVAAFLIGGVLTNVHRYTRHGQKPVGRSIEHAQVLLCIAGALMMIIIGDSLARAFGIAGGASIVRFRTPVEDPKDAMILFLSLGLGMSCGLGAFAVAGLGTAFMCGVLVFLARPEPRRPRAMMLSLASSAAEFPTAHVQRVFERRGIQFETREVSHGDAAEVKYKVRLDPDLSLDALSDELRQGGDPGIKSVVWEQVKKSR